jgi:hypothetical protein
MEVDRKKERNEASLYFLLEPNVNGCGSEKLLWGRN